MKRSFAFGAAVVAALAAAGCTTVEYYSQAVFGHLDVVRRAQPVEPTLVDPATPADLRQRLERALAARDFASRELALPDNGSYRRYADLGRPYVVWNVFAAPELSVVPVESCFPVAGCVTYRGYYAREDADRHAASLRAQGYDIHVGGVPAYSTLGWFDDPLLNTFIHYPTAELARLIFHELSHQVVYVKGDTTFNESFAVAVEREGLRRWFERHGSEADRASYARLQRMRDEFVGLSLAYRKQLAELYAGSGTVEEKRAGKARLLAAMRADYESLKAGWGGFAGYDRIFADGVNNAFLASVATYTEHVPAFTALLEREDRDFARFYAAVRDLAKLDKPARDAKLASLAAAPRIAGR